MTDDISTLLVDALWKIYRRPDLALPWTHGSDLLWSNPAFSERILGEHLDNTHGAASRPTTERAAQIDWLWSNLELRPGSHLLDITCGPGLYAVEFARRGCTVTGLDFSPASIAYANDLALIEGVAANCVFIEQDIRQMDYSASNFEAALFLYGQLAVFPPVEVRPLLARIAQSLKPDGRLCIELLNQEHVDKNDSTWWFTDDTGLWGDGPFLHLGERFWHPAEQASVERYHIIHLETGELNEIYLSDQTYAVEIMIDMMKEAGFSSVEVYPAWDGLSLGDAEEWVIYMAQK